MYLYIYYTHLVIQTYCIILNIKLLYTILYYVKWNNILYYYIIWKYHTIFYIILNYSMLYIYCIILKHIILYHEYSRKTSTSGGRPATLHASEPPDRLLQSFALEAASHLRWMELGLVIVPRGNNYTNHQCQTSSTINGWPQRIPSGKHTKSYGQSPC